MVQSKGILKLNMSDSADLTQRYSDKRNIKCQLLRMERTTAHRLSFLLTNARSLQSQQLASDLEWLLTWKLKTGCCPERMWCDGVELQQTDVHQKNKIKIRALAWIGPESTDELFQVPVEGTMELKSTGKQFKRYHFHILYQGMEFVVSKNQPHSSRRRLNTPLLGK